MHRRANILQYVKTRFERWQWDPLAVRDKP
jgi:hypothetical protein